MTKEELKNIDNYEYERNLRKEGIKLIAGVDEVGRGPLVGPVVTACVVLDKDFKLEGLTDSKKLSEKKRDMFYDILQKDAIAIGVGIIDAKIIDEVNIYQASKLAMYEALKNLKIKPEHVLIDAMPLDLECGSTSIIHGDALSASIAAASIIAKVTRDRMTEEWDKTYPLYGFSHNRGYGTKMHIEAIYKYGPCKLHRKTFEPIKSMLQ